MVDFIGIERVRELVDRLGAARFIEELAGRSRRITSAGANSTNRRDMRRIRR